MQFQARNGLDGTWSVWMHPETDFMLSRCLSRNIRSSAVTSPPRRSPPPRFTACASSHPTKLSPSLVSGTSSGKHQNVTNPIVLHLKTVFSQLKKVKKANGEIIGVNVVRVITMWSLAAVQVAGGMGTDLGFFIACPVWTS